MVKQQKDPEGKGIRKKRGRIELIDFTAEDKRPEMAVYVVDRSFNTIEVCDIGDRGQFQLSEEALGKAHKVVFGPKVEDLSSIKKNRLSIYRLSQFRRRLDEEAILVFSRRAWRQWLPIRRCVSGSVIHCYPYPWVINQYTLEAARATLPPIPGLSTLQEFTRDLIDIGHTGRTIGRHRHEKVCDALVEVYRRICCCQPWIILDHRLPDLIYELERLIPDTPRAKWTPQLNSNPVSFAEAPFFEGGALDERAINARRDLHAIRTLPPQDVPAYINARPYLHCCCCHCSSPIKVAKDFINDGEFNICWNEWPLLRGICHDEEYAFVVKQSIDGETITIYDGIAANAWFRYGDHANLVSYHNKALTCRVNEIPGEDTGAFAMLLDIGRTKSYRLKTPDAAEWDRVAVPVYNDGLAYPTTDPADAKGADLNRNWGGTLLLLYHFSEPMKAIGAKYYRVSVVAADSNGNPDGPRSYQVPSNWTYLEEAVGGGILTKPVSLGPNSKGGEDNLYEIPYDDDHEWKSNQYHAVLNTSQLPNERHLLTLEVFDSTGRLLRPTGTPDPGGSVQADYTYHRWKEDTGKNTDTKEVPFAGLTHMLWWDNRSAVAQIVDLRVDGVENTQECQFLLDGASSRFSIGYRSYHPNPMFMLNHSVSWSRGLGSVSGKLHPADPNNPGAVLPWIVDNVGVPPAVHESASSTFSDMLRKDPINLEKCAFTVTVYTNVKTFNGFGTLDSLDDQDQASFAMEIDP